MSESLNVIALISGGKDSFYSLIHCFQNGHKVVALGNLYPRAPSSASAARKSNNVEDKKRTHQLQSPNDKVEEASENRTETDLNSFMYQTVGHTVIPLYEQVLGIPLYRQEILGTAVETGTSYQQNPQSTQTDQTEDETESLVPLLKRIMVAHPEANAISTGAILSTYQRTRIESVALRLGLVPLGYLWQYPNLPPGTQVSLLQDMSSISLDARIIKVASGGLDEDFLWENVASVRGITRVERAMKRFGNDGDGSVIGEGGEFETLVVDGPDWLFKGRIEIDETDRRIVREGGGAAWLAMERAKVVMKDEVKQQRSEVRSPNMLDEQFERSLNELGDLSISMRNITLQNDGYRSHDDSALQRSEVTSIEIPSSDSPDGSRIHWTIPENPSDTVQAVDQEIAGHVKDIKELLSRNDRPASDIIFALIILRSMDDFAVINKVYGSLFTEPNPPARVTIASGDILPNGQHVILHLTLRERRHLPETKKALHVQSRSYWAPANIGPYSQAISVPSSPDLQNRLIHVAGQIPLIPATMILPEPSPTNFELQTILSLQHLWRIGIEMGVSWWTSAVAFLPRDSPENLSRKAQLAGQALDMQFQQPSENDEEGEERDLWEENYRGGFGSRNVESTKKVLPDWDCVKGENTGPPFFAAEVEMLPRGSGIEWYAHLGAVGEGIKVPIVSEQDGGLLHTCSVGSSIKQLVLLIPDKGATNVQGWLQTTKKNLVADGSEIVEVYVDATLCALHEIQGLVPCRSLWDKSGRRLAAVLVARSTK